MRILAVAAMAALTVLPMQAQDSGAEREKLKSTRDTLSKWVETQQIISSEKKEWVTGKEVLEQRVEMVENEIETLRGRVAETRKAIGETEKTRAELLAEERALKEASASLADQIPGLENRTRELIKLLPESVAAKVSVLAERIPEDPTSTSQSLSQRLVEARGHRHELTAKMSALDTETLSSPAGERRRRPWGEVAP